MGLTPHQGLGEAADPEHRIPTSLDPAPDRAAAVDEPRLTVADPSGTPTAMVLVLHGGRPVGHETVPPWSSAALRMHPLAWAIRRHRDDLTIALLRYRYRGWNGTAADPVTDARFAIRALTRRHPEIPIILVGHSMGARAALRCAGDPAVRGVLALAPWLPPDEPIEQLRGRALAVAHGTRDRTTSSTASADYARRAESIAHSVLCCQIVDGDHGMLRRASTWHHLSAQLVGALADGTDPRAVVLDLAEPDATPPAGQSDCIQL